MRRIILLILSGLLVFSTWCFAKYPSRTIHIIVPSKAGGSTDTTARFFIEVAKKYWPNAEMIVVDKPGAGGQIGFEAIARSRPDGYTVGMIFTPQIVAHIVAKRARYTLKSFYMVGNIAEDPGIVVVNAKSPIKNLKDLAKLAKSKKLSAAVNGIGSDDFLAAKQFEKVAGVTFKLMPTKGSVEQKAAVLGGHVDVAFMNLSQMLAQHKAGKARIIAILSTKRSDAAPDIPTSIEQGFKVLMTAKRGMVLPAKVNNSIKKKWSELLKKVVNDPEFKEHCKKSFIFINYMPGDEFRKYLEKLQESVQEVYNKNPW